MHSRSLLGRNCSTKCGPLLLTQPWTDSNAIRDVDSDGPKEPCIRLESRSPIHTGNLQGGKWRVIVNYVDTLPWAVQQRLMCWTDRDAVWDAESGGTKEPCIRRGPSHFGVQMPQREGKLLGVSGQLKIVQHRICGGWVKGEVWKNGLTDLDGIYTYDVFCIRRCLLGRQEAAPHLVGQILEKKTFLSCE